MAISKSIIFSASFSLACCAHAAPSDNQAADIINSIGHSCTAVKIGKNVVGNKMMNKQLLSEGELGPIQQWVKAGLVTLQTQENAPTDMFLTGVTKYVIVTPTPAGLMASQKSSCGVKKPNLLWIEVSTLKVEKILSNEEVRTALDTYRVVKGFATEAITDISRQLYPNAPAAKKLKFIALLKLDLFSKEWKFQTIDTANVDDEFTSNNVQSHLANAKH